MTLHEIEACDKLLRQGVDLSRETVRKLVDFAMQHRPRYEHQDGCAWWRGAGCDCREPATAIDLRVKEALASTDKLVEEAKAIGRSISGADPSLAGVLIK